MDDYLRRHRLYIFGLVAGFGFGLYVAGQFTHRGYLIALGSVFMLIGFMLYHYRNDLK